MKMKVLVLLGVLFLTGCAAAPVHKMSAEHFESNQCTDTYVFHPTSAIDGYFDRIVSCAKVEFFPQVNASDLPH